MANVPGMMLGAVAGNRLGAIRDAKGKSVATVFGELGAIQRAEVSRERRNFARLNTPRSDSSCVGSESARRYNVDHYDTRTILYCNIIIALCFVDQCT